MARITKDDPDTFHRVLVMGLSGVGKTTLVAALAEKYQVTMLDLENGKDTLLKLPEYALENINYIRIKDSASYPIAAQTLMTLFKQGKAEICEEHSKHACPLCKKEGKPVEIVDFSEFANDPNKILFIDTISQLSASVFAYTTKDKPVEYKPERDDWGALRKYTEFFASQFQAFPGNLVVTAHIVEAELEDSRTKLVPNFGSKDMSSKIAKAFSDVVYCEVKNKKHVAFSSSTASNNILTKSRSDFNIEDLEVPSLIPLFDIREAKKVIDAKASASIKPPLSTSQSSQASTLLNKLKLGGK